ncbi:hypothetical protein FGO68_gene13311 [Halteria grandinella]|uniref:Uncharacterized protein n=1 Tax=Halteria grandinella TaxID=5974 RepID=A0A8J8P459_HALGN|nr:hypothetical protein FGO68_gene13311 [Halteria grandinella]
MAKIMIKAIERDANVVLRVYACSHPDEIVKNLTKKNFEIIITSQGKKLDFYILETKGSEITVKLLNFESSKKQSLDILRISLIKGVYNENTNTFEKTFLRPTILESPIPIQLSTGNLFLFRFIFQVKCRYLLLCKGPNRSLGLQPYHWASYSASFFQ